MPGSPLNAQAQTMLAVAALVAAFAQTQNESDESFRARLDAKIERTYKILEDRHGAPALALETLRMTHEMLGGLANLPFPE